MATRNFPSLNQSNILKLVTLDVMLQGNGTSTPTLSYGDPKGTYFSAPVNVGTGSFTITTQDAYPQYVGCNLEYITATASATTCAVIAPLPVQNANGTWTFTINCFTASFAAVIASTSMISFTVFMQNTNDPYAG